MEEKLLKKLSLNKEKNIKLIKKRFNNYRIGMDRFLFEVLMYKDCDLKSKKITLCAIESLLECGADPNYDGYFNHYCTILDYALFKNYSEEFILELIPLLAKYNFNFNAKDCLGNTNIHEVFGHMDRQVKITNIYNALVANGYDIFLTDRNYNTLEDLTIKGSSIIEDWRAFLAKYNKDRKEFFEVRKNEIIKKINDKYPDIKSLNNSINEKRNLIYKLLLNHYDEEIILEVIKELINKGLKIDFNMMYDDQYMVENLIRKSHKEKFIIDFINLGIEYGIEKKDINKNCKIIINDLITHKYKGPIIQIYLKMKECGFEPKIEIKDGKNIYELLKDNNVKIMDKDEFMNYYSNDFKNNIFNNSKDYEQLKKIGTFIDNKSYDENYKFDEIIDSIDKKSILITSKKAGGKTLGLNTLANYIFSTGNAVVFLTSSDEIIKNSNSISETRLLLLDLMKKCAKYEIVLCIDDLDKLYNLNGNNLFNDELNILLYHFINNTNLLLISTLNEEHNHIIMNSILNNSVYMLDLEKYNETNLKDIIKNMLLDLRKEKIIIDDLLLSICEEIIYVIINKDEYKNVSKIKVVKDIINSMHDCIKDNKEYIEINDLIYSIRVNNYIKEEIKETVINELNNLNNNYNEKNVELMIKKLIK